VPYEMSSVLLFDPRGIVDQNITPIALRKAKLEGLRLGILDNSKWNANKLLRGASAALSEDIKFAAVNYYVKQSFSCIRDSVALEKLGIPSAAIITAEFVGETKLTRQALGMPDLEPVVIDHPVSSITHDEADARIRQIKERAQKVWIAG
jgi:hypothetical protein